MEENNTNEVQPNVEQPVTPVEPVQQEVQSVVPENNEPLPVVAPMPQKPKKRKKGLIITIIVLVLLAVGGLTTWLIISNNNSDSDEPDTEEKEEKKDNKKDSSKKIYFYKAFTDSQYGGYYGMKYDYNAPSDKNDILATYDCETDECEVAKETVPYGGSSDPNVEFYSVVIHEKEYDNYFNGKKVIKLNIKDAKKYDSMDTYDERMNEDILTYRNSDDSSAPRAIYSLITNKTITDFKCLSVSPVSIVIGNKIYYECRLDNNSSEYIEVTEGNKVSETDNELIDYLYNEYFKKLPMSAGLPIVEGYIDYIKDNGFTDIYYLASLGLGFDGSYKYRQDVKPSADECSLDNNGTQMKCDELTFYKADVINEDLYKYFGKTIEKKDIYSSDNKKIGVYVESIDSFGFAGKMIVVPGGKVGVSSVISYKINGNKADIKIANITELNGACDIKKSASTECGKYVVDQYNKGKADFSYTLHLIWDTDHYYIDDITFDK